jgi:hypothetical protein
LEEHGKNYTVSFRAGVCARFRFRQGATTVFISGAREASGFASIVKGWID